MVLKQIQKKVSDLKIFVVSINRQLGSNAKETEALSRQEFSIQRDNLNQMLWFSAGNTSGNSHAYL